MQASRKVAATSYELGGVVTLRNPTSSDFVLSGVKIEAVRPGEVRTVLTDSARCVKTRLVRVAL